MCHTRCPPRPCQNSKSAADGSAGPTVRATTGRGPFCPPITTAHPTDTPTPPADGPDPGPTAVPHARYVSRVRPRRRRNPRHAALTRRPDGDVRIKLPPVSSTSTLPPPLQLFPFLISTTSLIYKLDEGKLLSSALPRRRFLRPSCCGRSTSSGFVLA